MAGRILIIEDDESIAELERDYLEINGYETSLAFTGDEGLKMGAAPGFDLILLDLMLPGMDGFTLCRKLREKTDVPILIVTAKGEDIDKVRGLGLGADDYLCKPFSPSELVARVGAHLSRYRRLTGGAANEEAEICIDRLRILPAARRVYLGDRELALANKEFELLLFLAQNPNIAFSRESLFERVWGLNSMGDVSTVTVHVNRLREKLQDAAGSPRYIETVWGVGYRFSV